MIKCTAEKLLALHCNINRSRWSLGLAPEMKLIPTSFQESSAVMWGLARKDLMILAGVAAATFLTVIVVISCIIRMVRRKKKNKMEHLNRYG